MKKAFSLELILLLLAFISSCGMHNKLTYRKVGSQAHNNIEQSSIASISPLEKSPETKEIYFQTEQSNAAQTAKDTTHLLQEKSIHQIEKTPNFKYKRQPLKVHKTWLKKDEGEKEKKKLSDGTADSLAMAALIVSIVSVISGVTFALSLTGLALIVFILSAFAGHVMAVVEMSRTVGNPEERKSFYIALTAFSLCVIGLVLWLIYLYVELY